MTSPIQHRRFARVGALTLCAALLASCGTSDDEGGADDGQDGGSQPPATTDGAYVADSVAGHDLVEGSTVRVVLADGVMTVSAGCNTLSGEYVDDAGELRWAEEPERTILDCEPNLDEQDDWLSALFLEGVSIEASTDADLALTSGSVRLDLSRSEPGEAGARSALDFAARLNGAFTAEPSEVVLLTLTNIGRRRDTYGITVSPADAGAVMPRHVALGSGGSAKVRIKVRVTPVIVKVESIGAEGFVDAFTIQ